MKVLDAGRRRLFGRIIPSDVLGHYYEDGADKRVYGYRQEVERSVADETDHEDASVRGAKGRAEIRRSNSIVSCDHPRLGNNNIAGL